MLVFDGVYGPMMVIASSSQSMLLEQCFCRNIVLMFNVMLIVCPSGRWFQQSSRAGAIFNSSRSKRSRRMKRGGKKKRGSAQIFIICPPSLILR